MVMSMGLSTLNLPTPNKLRLRKEKWKQYSDNKQMTSSKKLP